MLELVGMTPMGAEGDHFRMTYGLWEPNATRLTWVARAGSYLLSVGDRKVGHGKAEVDKIVRRCQRSNLT